MLRVQAQWKISWVILQNFPQFPKLGLKLKIEKFEFLHFRPILDIMNL